MTTVEQITISLQTIRENKWTRFGWSLGELNDTFRRAGANGGSAQSAAFREALDANLREYSAEAASVVAQSLSGKSRLELSFLLNDVLAAVRQWLKTTVAQHQRIAGELWTYESQLHWAPEVASLFVRLEADIHQKLDGRLTESRNNSFYLNEGLVKRLERASKNTFDTSKLVRLCHELNHAWQSEAWFSVAYLTRAIVDHIPPVIPIGKGQFAANFDQVANNYSRAPGPTGVLRTKRSFKQIASNLNLAMKPQANAAIHNQISEARQELTEQQVDFRADLSGVLLEIAELLEVP